MKKMSMSFLLMLCACASAFAVDFADTYVANNGTTFQLNNAAKIWCSADKITMVYVDGTVSPALPDAGCTIYTGKVLVSVNFPKNFVAQVGSTNNVYYNVSLMLRTSCSNQGQSVFTYPTRTDAVSDGCQMQQLIKASAN